MCSGHQSPRKRLWGKRRLLPLPPALTKGQTETRGQASGDRQKSLSLLCTQVQRHPQDARTGWAPGGDDSGHPCQPGAGTHSSGSQKPGSNSGGWGRSGDKGVGGQLSLLGLQQLVGDTHETDTNTAVGSGPWEGKCDRVGTGLAGSGAPGGQHGRRRRGEATGTRPQEGLCSQHETGATGAGAEERQELREV